MTRAFDEIVLGFARTLRHAGVAAGPERVQAMLAAVGHLDVMDPDHVYWAGRLTLCGDPADLDRYDAAFAAYFSGIGQKRSAASAPPPVRLRSSPFEIDVPGSQRAGDDALAVAASAQETLRHRDVSALTADERLQLAALFALLAPRTGRRRTHRYGSAHRGRVDLGRTVRGMVGHGGELHELARRARRHRPRRLVMLIDVSGSMSPYADSMLRFAHAATRARPATTETFTIGTRLTRVSRELRHRDPDLALQRAGAAIPDWSGGTRLGEAVKVFLDRWGQRGVARGAVVVLASDGWERGDPGLLGEQVHRLSRLAHDVVWVNPHKGKDGFAPITGGMLAAMPHVDHLVAGHSFAALQQLVEVIADA